METKKELLRKMEEAETEYKKEQRRIENTIDEAAQENQKFRRELEELANYMRYISQKQQSGEELEQAYRMIDYAQEDGNRVVRKTIQKLEDTQEEQRINYQKKNSFYEEQLTILKNERELNDA